MRTRSFSVQMALAAALSVTTGGCIFKTDMVGTAFNGGALSGPGDPFRIPSQLAASRVERILEEELADGYFHQGPGGEVGRWLVNAQRDAAAFADRVMEVNEPLRIPAGGPTASAALDARDRAQEDLVNLTTSWTGPRAPLCKAEPGQEPPGPGAPQTVRSGVRDPAAIESFLDEVRFEQAVLRAARRIAALLKEGLVRPEDVRAAAPVAFEKTAAYLGKRRWTRRERRKTAGLAVEGGAASGIFSAGAVWVVLNLMDGWMSECNPGDEACKSDHDIGFRLISGTSTGAMVTVAVDRFSSAKTHAGRQREIDNVAKWFTCFSFTDLMCAQSAPITALISSMGGVLKFDGIEKVLTSCVKPWMFENPSELIVNTTEFRSGRLFSLSDQNELTRPEDVVRGAVASALLPLIGQPSVDLPANRPPFDVVYDKTKPDRTAPAYLDGGIRSELPILPLVRRGAERVLTVASGSSVIGETNQLTNALAVGVRYINVNTGAVTETELEYAQRQAESVRQAEIDACMNALDPIAVGPRVTAATASPASASAAASPAPPASASVAASPALAASAAARAVCDGPGKPPYCNRWNVCHGDLENTCVWTPSAAFADLRADETKHSLARRLEPFWKMESIFLDEANVDQLAGYDFRPGELRRLFRAGAEAARVRCLDLATLLGILEEREPETPAKAEKVRKINQWCGAQLKDTETTCAGRVPGAAPFEIRVCDDPVDLTKLPPYLDACKGEEAPQ